MLNAMNHTECPACRLAACQHDSELTRQEFRQIAFDSNNTNNSK